MADAAVVGSGPNGLAAAVTLARAGLSVVVHEAASTVGGGTRTAALTLPGFRHDTCAAVHPLALASPFFRAFELARRVELLVPEISYAHPLEHGRAAVAYRDLDRTAAGLGVDGPAWRRLLQPLVDRLDGVIDFTLHGLVRVPQDPLAVLTVAARVLEQGSAGWGLRFRDELAPALLTGAAAHSMGRLPGLATAGAGLLLTATGHAGGWPVPRGGSQAIADALLADLLAHGGQVVTDAPVTSLAQLRAETGARAVICDVSPRQLARLGAAELPAGYLRRLRAFRYGSGVCKVDFALSGPVPWRQAELRHAPTLHLGGSRAAIAAAERQVLAGGHPAEPYVLAVQPGVIDDSRAPQGRHTFWAYTHVPPGSTEDRTAAITAQVERYAPGFRDLILATSTATAQDMERHNVNYVGGDIGSGALTLRQLLRRPVVSTEPWRTPAPGLYLGSASAPPGPGVHGMAGWLAATAALRHTFALPAPHLGLAPP